MKERLLDVEAILSQAAAWLTIENPNVDKAKEKISDARDLLFEIVEDIEKAEKN